MRRNRVVTLIAGAVFLLGAAMCGRADVVTFTFNPLADGVSSSAIQAYMNGILGAGRSVVVTGAVAEQNYNGDNHVVGPSRSLTLGTSDGATNGTTPTPTGSPYASGYDTFVRNISTVDRFSFVFTGFPIYGVSFDYEIFPDGTCANGNVASRCNSNWPDFKFEVASNGGTSTTVFQYYGVMPGTATATPEVKFSTTAGWWSYSNSPAPGTTEYAPQLLGTFDTYFSSPVTTLTFRDWPATIGIDNLVIHTPEPGSILLLGTCLAACLGGLRRKFRGK